MSYFFALSQIYSWAFIHVSMSWSKHNEQNIHDMQVSKFLSNYNNATYLSNMCDNIVLLLMLHYQFIV